MELAAIAACWPGREEQIDALARAMGERPSPLRLTALFLAQPHELTRPLLLHGPPGSGKTAIVRAVLDGCKAPRVTVDLALCATARAVSSETVDGIVELLRSRASARAPKAIHNSTAHTAMSTLTGDGIDSVAALLRAHFGGRGAGR
ncbi:hypothetical protein T492DRAFT_855748 [Pavlovales sp. CCMP2436]|nr:hypothetical protein T492DRAFT_855748 [Pavlovales sp. CCMP2436]